MDWTEGYNLCILKTNLRIQAPNNTGSDRIINLGVRAMTEMLKVKEILQRKKERKIKLESSLELIVDQLRRLGAQKIILFGSLATGDVDVNSDLDLFVIMPSTKTGKEWTDIAYEVIDRRVATHFIVYNQEEFFENLPVSSFLQNVVKGKVVYEKAA